MRQHRNYSANDDVPTTDGDNGFIGVDMRTSPHLLQPGYVSDARNSRFRFGVAEPRKGTMPVAWSNIRDSWEWPVNWDQGDINFQGTLRGNFGKVFGVGVWNDPDGVDWVLVASSTDNVNIKIYRLRPGNNSVEVKVSVPLTVPVTAYQDVVTEDLFWFTQAFNQCIISRGPDAKHLVLTNFEEGFIEVPDASGAGGTENLPNADSALFFQNRFIVPHKPTGGYKADVVSFSDIQDLSSYDPVYSQFRINQGDSDAITRLYKFNDSTVIVFKETSIYSVSNLVGSWGTNAVLDQVTSEFGLVGPRSVANVGKDLWFLSQRGVVSLSQTEQNKLHGISEPNSSPIQPVIDRIDMGVAKATACAAYWQNKYYLSVPLDGSQQNNAVLVYDFLNKAWAGYDEGEAIKIKYFFVADFQGTESLFYVDYSGGVGLYEYGETEGVREEQTTYTCDVVVNTQPPISSSVTVNNGTKVVGTRLSPIQESEGDLVSDGVDNFVEDPQTNAQDTDGVWDMGEESGGHCDIPADNLYAGYSDGTWQHNTDSVSQTDCGVRFLNSTPFLVNTSDPYITSICSEKVMVEDRPINFMVVTRGYGFNAGKRRRYQDAQIFISTWDPQYKVTAITDGVKEQTVLLDDTSYTFPGRTKYMTFAVEDWPITNINDDHEKQGRGDYSVILDATQPGGGTVLGSTGTVLDLHQYYTHSLRVDQRGSYFQIKFEGLQGRIRIHSITSGSTSGQRREGLHH